MIQAETIRDRIILRVPQLAGRIGLATEFGRIMEANQVPQQTPAAYVLPGGLVGGAASAVTGLFRQDVRDGVKVVLFVRVAGDPLGDRGRKEAEPLFRAIIENLVGWCPDDALGVLLLERALLVGSANNCLVYEIDFYINDQLRIAVS